MSAGTRESGRAGAPGRSTLRLMRFTPMRDVVRGRLSGRLDARHVIESAGLPAVLRDLAWEVVRRTRLRRMEKVDVARELVAHFSDAERDAMERGEGDAGGPGAVAATVASSFGDAKTAARLIRRAKKRNRGPVWKATVWTGRAAGVVVLLAAVWYGWAAARYFTGRPNVAVDYVGRINARVMAVPEGERAWPEYKAAWMALPAEVISAHRNDELTSRMPGGSGWREAVDTVEGIQAQLQRVREASRRGVLGVMLSGNADPDLARKNLEVQRLLDPSAESPAPLPARSSAETPLITVLLEHLSVLRGLTMLLALDARVAVASGDGARAGEDLATLIRLAGHADEDASLISQLVSISILMVGKNEAARTLATAPDLLTDAQLVELAHELAAYRNGDITLDYSLERRMVLDTIQRVFTDDGSGGGRPCAAGFADFGGESFFELFDEDSTMRDPNIMGATGPVLASVSASRKETMRAFDRFYALASEQAAAPLWEQAWASPAGAYIEELVGTGYGKLRYWALWSLTPAVSRAIKNAEIATQQRDAILVAIALELFKRDTGSYPATLEELVPRFLPSVPPDRYTGMALSYRLDDTGRPMIYSFGNDHDDDAGRSTVDRHGMRDDKVGAMGMSREQFEALEPDRQAAYDGDWILFPPAEAEPAQGDDEDSE